MPRGARSDTVAVMRVVAAALGSALVAILATGPSVSRAELLAFLDGDVRPIATTTLFAAPGASAASFWLFSGHPDHDLRSEPGALVLFTESGLLVAEADAGTRRFGPWRFDTESGRPLRRDANGDAGCATGQEPACWRPGDPVPYSSEVAAALSIGPIRFTYAQPVTVRTPVPLVPLYSDPADSLVPAKRDPADWFLPANPNPTETLSDEQQALLGCGPFWGIDCATDGIDISNADASVLMQSWDAFESPFVAGTVPPGVIRVPGARSPGDMIAFADIPRTGGFGATADLPSNALLLPYGGNTFLDEMAALSFNFQNLLVAFSAPVAPKGEPSGSSDYDPTDPFSRAPSQCSFAQPQYCASVSAFFSLATTAQPLDDDPDGSRLHWIWEAGAEYRVIEATGDFADYAGGRVHVLGVEHSRTRRASLGIPMALFPAPNAALDPASAFAMPATGGATTSSLGLAYLTIPEPSAAALTAAAIAALTLLARRHQPAA